MKETPDTLNSQAIELAAQGCYSEAIACFKRAISISKENYLLWYNLGVTYRDSGNLELAKDSLTQAQQLTTEDAEVYEALAHVLFLLGDYSESLEVNVEGLELFPNNAHIWNNIGVLYFTNGEYSAASEAFEQAVTLYPYYYDALYNLRDAYNQLGNIEGSKECDNQLKKIANKNGGFYA